MRQRSENMADRVGSASALCVLLLCFDGAKRAAQIRRPLSKQLEQSGNDILDAAIIRVDGEGNARVYDPQRTLAGVLTAALTWGVFGLLTSGVIGPIGWAVIGAVCGGLFAYYKEQPLGGTQLRRIGEGLRRDSSALVVFTTGGVDTAVLPTAAAYGPTTASLVAISWGLSARVLAGAGSPTEVAAAVSGGPMPPADTSTLLNLLLVRLPGRHAARQALAQLAPTKTPDPDLPQVKQVEVVLESDARGGLHAHSPNFGVGFSAKSSLMSWGVLGLIFGAVGGFTGGGGILAILGGGLITAVAWGAFGALAGALYGLFVGNVLSFRQLKKLDDLVPPNSSLAFVWADGDLPTEAVDRWALPGAQRLVVRFDSTPQGIVLGV
jgi:uncharacterized membrane protein